MDATSINDLPGDNINFNNDEAQNMNQMISSVQQASQGGIIGLPSRDIPIDTESNVVIDPEVKQNYIREPPVDYIKNMESAEELVNNIKKDERAELKQIELYDSIHAYVIMACVYFFLMLPFFHKNIMMKYFSFGLGSDGNMNIKGYLLKTIIFVGVCFSITESINYLDRISDI
jgi:hypothetical protein